MPTKITAHGIAGHFGVLTLLLSAENMSASQLSLTITLMVTMPFWGCDRDDYYAKKAQNNSLTSFQRPADGKLTEQQVADYVVIRQKIIADVKAQKLAKQISMTEHRLGNSSGFDFRHFDEIEMVAADSFNMSYDEFQWIKDTVITTQTQLLVKRYYELNHRIMTLLDQTLTRYKEINTAELEWQEQQIMNGYVAEMKQEMTYLRGKITDPNARPEALENNIAMITKFTKELEALQKQSLLSFTP